MTPDVLCTSAMIPAQTTMDNMLFVGGQEERADLPSSTLELWLHFFCAPFLDFLKPTGVKMDLKQNFRGANL